MPLGSITDISGQQLSVVETSLQAMERTPYIKAAFDQFRKKGLGNVLDSIGGWFITDNQVD